MSFGPNFTVCCCCATCCFPWPSLLSLLLTREGDIEWRTLSHAIYICRTTSIRLVSNERALLYRTCGARTITRSQSYHATAQLLQQARARVEGAAHDAGRPPRPNRLHAGGEQERHAARRVGHGSSLVVARRVLFEQRGLRGREREADDYYKTFGRGCVLGGGHKAGTRWAGYIYVYCYLVIYIGDYIMYGGHEYHQSVSQSINQSIKTIIIY